MSNNPLTSKEIKAIAGTLGTDLCGIAPASRFEAAPEGFRPVDIYSKAASVIVFAKRLPAEVLYAESCIPYTRVNALITEEVDRLSLMFSLVLQDAGIKGVMVPSDDPFEYWEAERQYGRGILSMRHAAVVAGLGRLGRNNLLINKQYGNMLQIGAVLVAAAFEYDEPVSYEVCPEGCRRCLDVCPQQALDGITVVQKECRVLSNFKTEKGYILKKCHECRRVCPHATGIRDES
jgi:epoxyqueuosine reductase